MKQWVQVWNAFWFPKTTTRYLGICRIVAVTAQLWFFFPPVERNIELLEWSAGFIDPQWLIVVLSVIFPVDVFLPLKFLQSCVG